MNPHAAVSFISAPPVDHSHSGSLPLAPDVPPALDRQYPVRPHPVRPRRRKADGSTLSHLLFHLPQFLCSFVVVWFVAQLFGGITEAGVILGWLASGLVFVMYRPAEEILARVYFKCRKPTLAQEKLLDRLWAEVTSAAGVDGSKYTLWVQDSKEINAFAAGGHIVGVTRWALEKQPPDQLTAVLAHELGHHMGGHSWSLLLGTWYALPGRVTLNIAWTVTRFVARFALAVARTFSLVAYLFVYIVLASMAFAVFAVAPFMLAVYLIIPILAWLGRNSEKRADRFAAEIGYGPLLIGALNTFQEQDDQDVRVPLIARLMATHPPLHDRIRRLEEFEQGLSES